MLKPKVDFQVIQTYEPKLLMIADASFWGPIEKQPAIIEIKYNDNAIYADPFKKKQINVFDSYKIFNEWDRELPDGLYEITVKGSPSQFNKNRYLFRTQQLLKEIDYLYMNDRQDKKYREDLWDIFHLYQGIQSYTRRGEIKKAEDSFKLLKVLVKNTTNKVNCSECKV